MRREKIRVFVHGRNTVGLTKLSDHLASDITIITNRKNVIEKAEQLGFNVDV